MTTLPADTNYAGGTWSSAISPDGRYLGAVGNGVRIWKLTNGPPTNGSPAWTNAPFLSSPVGVSGLGFDRSGRHVYFQDRLALEGQQEVLGISRLLLEPPSTERQIVATNIQNKYAQPLCILPRRGELAYTTRRRELIILDLDSGRAVRRIPTLPEGPRDAWFIANLRASPDETRFALVTTSGLGVEIRDRGSDQEIHRPGVAAPLLAVAEHAPFAVEGAPAREEVVAPARSGREHRQTKRHACRQQPSHRVGVCIPLLFGVKGRSTSRDGS